MKMFDEFLIYSIPLKHNSAAHLLENVSFKLISSSDILATSFSMQLLFSPLVLENITNYRVFDDDDQIINFLYSKDIFKDSAIDDRENDEKNCNSGTQKT